MNRQMPNGDIFEFSVNNDYLSDDQSIFFSKSNLKVVEIDSLMALVEGEKLRETKLLVFLIL